MHISIFEPALLRSLLAGAVMLAGTSACSRPDRADAGGETNQPSTAAQPTDTQATAVTATTDTGRVASTSDTAAPPRAGTTAADQGVSGYQPMGRDTNQSETASQTPTSDQTDTVAVGDSAHIGKAGERLEGNKASEQANQDTLEEQSEADRIRPPEDSSETSGAAVGSSEMARDTNVEVAQGDTMVQADTGTGVADAETAAVSVEVDTTTTAQAPQADTSAIQVSVDTTTAEQQTEDTAVVVGDSTEAGRTGERLEPEVVTAEANADTLTSDVDRIRPPEDSTEVLGNVTTDEPKAETAEVETRDAAVAGAAGVASTGDAVTGVNAVAQMTRQGQSCSVVTNSEEVRWDMAMSPATLNPCGTGTMTLPKIVTGEE